MSRLQLVLGLGLGMLTLTGCEPITPSDVPDAGGNSGGTSQDGSRTGGSDGAAGVDGLRPYVAPGLGGPQTIVAAADAYLPLAVDAAIRASVLANGGATLVTVGTVTQTAPQQFRYSPTPDDRLRLELSDGRRFAFFFDAIDGNLNSDGQSFMSRAHELTVRIVIEGDLDVNFESSLRAVPGRFFDYERRFTARGQFSYDSQTCDADLQAEGTHYFENDQTGFEGRDDLRYQGTITGPNATIQVDERWQFHNVGAESDRRGFVVASSVVRTASNAWTTASGDKYALQEATIRSAFSDGIPQDPGFWSAGGRLLLNGAEYGRLELSPETHFIRAVLVLPEGRIEVQNWPTGQ